MCTSIRYQSFFARNMDWNDDFLKDIVITPRNYSIILKNGEKMKTQYAMLGMALVQNDYPLYAEAANEYGLAIAGLNFPGFAFFSEPKDGKINLTQYELPLWLLGNFKSLQDIKNILPKINITNIPANNSLSIFPLHWMLGDKKGSIVLEQGKNGIKIYENPFNVLTNSPPFPYHYLHTSNYLNLTSEYPTNRLCKKLPLSIYSKGMGAIGLPGDDSSSSRFVKSCFLLCNSDWKNNIVQQMFHILDSVAILKGHTKNENGTYDYTIYSSCFDLENGIYYFKTYNDFQIRSVKLEKNSIFSTTLTIYSKNQKETTSNILNLSIAKTE